MKLLKLTMAQLLVLALLCVSMSGCWDRVELEDHAWVTAMGFDKDPEGRLLISFQVAIPANVRESPTGGSGQGPDYLTLTLLARGGLEALDLAAVNLGRRVSLVHTQLFVFGEELAKSGVASIVATMDRFREVRGSALVAMAKGKASDVLRVNVAPLDASPARFIQSIMEQHSNTGLFTEAALAHDFINPMGGSAIAPICPIIALSADYKQLKGESGGGGGGSSGGNGSQDPGHATPSTPEVGQEVETEGLPPAVQDPAQGAAFAEAQSLPKLGGSPVTIMGTAVFSHGEMVGTFSGEETRIMHILKGDFERAAFSVPDPQFPDNPELFLSLELGKGKHRIRVEREGENVRINADVDLVGAYISMRTATDYSDPRNTPLAEQAVASYIKQAMDGAILKAQEEMGVDPFGFGEKVRRTFWTWPEFEAFAWHTKFPDAEISTTVNVRIKRYGMDLAPPATPPWKVIEQDER